MAKIYDDSKIKVYFTYAEKNGTPIGFESKIKVTVTNVYQLPVVRLKRLSELEIAKHTEDKSQHTKQTTAADQIAEPKNVKMDVARTYTTRAKKQNKTDEISALELERKSNIDSIKLTNAKKQKISKDGAMTQLSDMHKDSAIYNR